MVGVAALAVAGGGCVVVDLIGRRCVNFLLLTGLHSNGALAQSGGGQALQPTNLVGTSDDSRDRE